MPDADAAPSSSGLHRVLAEIQRRGAIGRGPVDEAVEHSLQFVAALPAEAGTLVDLGSGGGLPGVVIAVHAPMWTIHLIERRAKRADLLRYAVQALDLGNRVTVHESDARIVAASGSVQASVVTARSFAPPLEVLAMARPFLVSGGDVVISEPPAGQPRWEPVELARLGVVDLGRLGGVRRFRFRS